MPENTLPAFESALRQGVRYLETDCRATRDGEPVLLHDADVSRTTDGEGAVGDYTWAELARLDAGHGFAGERGGFPFRGRGLRVPRLAELLEGLPEARLNLELKESEPALAEAVLDAVRAAGAADRVLLTSADDAAADRLHRLSPETALGSSVGDVLAFARALEDGTLDRFEPRGHALQIPVEFMGQPLVEPRIVAAAHRAGLQVHVWTVDDPAEMRRLLALGIDGLMSNYPGRLVEAARSAPAGADSRSRAQRAASARTSSGSSR